MGKYTPKAYVQKSLAFLYPLLGIREKPLGTYLYWDKIEEDIIGYYILVEYPLGTNIDSKYLHTVYPTKDSEVFVFDMQHLKEDVDHFLNGEYSKFTEKSKEIILRFKRYTIGGRVMTIDYVKKDPSVRPIFHVAFYPLQFIKEVAEEYGQGKIFGSVREALNALRGVTELLDKFDLKKETLNKEL